MSNQFYDAMEAELRDLKRRVAEQPSSKDVLFRLKELVDSEIGESPSSQSGIRARILRARAYEDGMFGEVNNEAALEDYAFIMEHGAKFRSEGMVGTARLLGRKDRYANADKALSLCAEAIRLDSNVRAMMVAGYIYEHVKHDLDSAAKWYMSAFKNRQRWGLRSYASVQYKKNKLMLSLISYITAAIVGPLIDIRYGKSDPFKL